jgi:alpha-amylase
MSKKKRTFVRFFVQTTNKTNTMKKFFLILAAFVSAMSLQAASYGILVNDTVYFAGTPSGQYEGFDQYLAHVKVKAGDKLTLCDAENDAKWVVPLNEYSVAGFTLNKDHYDATVTGCYDFYIKLKYGEDQLYIGNGSDCGDGEPYQPVEKCPEAFGLKVGDAIIVGQKNTQQTEWNEWMVLNVALTAGQQVQLYDTCTHGAWAVPVDLAGYPLEMVNDSYYVIPEDGTYHFYIKLIMGNDQLYVGKEGWVAPTYGVPGQCEAVSMQGFYWNSYMKNDSATATNLYGDTRWKTMLDQANEIGAYFDMIWLPPSAAAGGTGYYPRQYSNQNSDWGSRADLEKLIASFHNSGMKVVADVVLDHMIAQSSWCDFATMDFGKYGKYTPDLSWICRTDEVNDPATKGDTLAGPCWGLATGPDDEGDNNIGARDLAHASSTVQEFSKAYLQWLLDEMKYDGFRWDEAKGFDPRHIGEYNAVANPYISFVERWSGTDDMIWTIDRSGYRTMALDFQTKYSVFDALAGWHYETLANRGWGLVGSGYSKYAVTFIDSHDWFLRNDQEFAGQGNSMKSELKGRLMQANAWLLSMPGVPSVFYPHWAKYKEDIKPMIVARHLAGVHSESEVKDEQADGNGYQATVVGKNGWLILQLGNRKTTTPWDDNYKLIASGDGYAIWVHALHDVAPGIIVNPGNTAFEDSVAGIKVTIKAVGGSSDPIIYYTTDGNDPTTASAVYSDTLTFKQTTLLKVMAVCGTAQSKVQEYTYTYREPLQHGIRVRFDKPEQWNKAYIFAWQPYVDEKGEDASVNLMGAYPGQRMYQDVDGWYTYEFDHDLGIDTIHFCINSGNDCGDINVRSNDLEADYDICIEWLEGKETEGEMEQVIEGCEKELDPKFDLAIVPESGFFRDQAVGQEVIIRPIGDPDATIYYTTDGTEPGPGNNMGQGEKTFTVNKTTTVKAYAESNGNRTDTYTAVYTYKAPQQGVITVKFIKPADWEDLYLYAFTRVMKTSSQYVDTPYSLDGGSAKWPGMKWTATDGQWNTYTMREVIPEGTDFYIIFNAGMNKAQSQDIFIAENTCYLWSDVCYRAVVDANCDGEPDEPWVEGIEVVENKVNTNHEAYKLIINGRLVIFHNGAMYDVLGRKL